MTTTMFLRVKRRRSATPASTIRLEGLDELPASTQASSMIHGGGEEKEDSSKRRTQQLQQQQLQQQEQNPHQQQRLVGSTGYPPTNHHYQRHQQQLGVTGTLPAPEPAMKRSCAVWKLLDTDYGVNNTSFYDNRSNNSSSSHINHGNTSIGEGSSARRTRPYYVVADAILEDDHRSKRRKLTLVETHHHEEFPLSSSILSKYAAGVAGKKTVGKNKHVTNASSVAKHRTLGPGRGRGRDRLRGRRRGVRAYPVLDPLSRLVDDSLQMCHSGNITVAQHYSFVMTDPRVAPDSKKWMAWCNPSGGNILHACARWNDVEIAHDLLRSQIDGLTDAADGDGCTPYETAQLLGHESVCQVLEAYGADTTKYVYDIFCLQKPSSHDDEQKMATLPKTVGMATATNGKSTTTTIHTEQRGPQQKQQYERQQRQPVEGEANDRDEEEKQEDDDEDEEDAPVSLELRGGVGYWTEDGELILEATSKETYNTLELDEYHDDIDSNCEDYGGNDYPEDEEWEEEFLSYGLVDRSAAFEHSIESNYYDHQGYYDLEEQETEHYNCLYHGAAEAHHYHQYATNENLT